MKHPLSSFPIHPIRLTQLTVALGLCALLQACSGITVRNEPSLSSRKMPAATGDRPAAKSAEQAAAPRSAAEGLKLARLLRDQGRFEAAASVYARLEQRGELRPLELLEYASVAAQVQPPQDSLALYGRARRALGTDSSPGPAATVALCNGLGRARMALGQTDAALGDFDCSLAAQPDDVTALNAKGVLLDARGEHVQARVLLNRALALDPADFRILNNLGLSWLASGDAAQAERLLSQAEGAPSASIKLNLAFAQALQDRDAQARRTLAGVMDAAQVQPALDDFAQIRQRVRDGQPVALELLAASRRLLPLRDKAGHG